MSLIDPVCVRKVLATKIATVPLREKGQGTYSWKKILNYYKQPKEKEHSDKKGIWLFKMGFS